MKPNWHSSNITIFPASLLPLADRWKALSQHLPAGTWLIIVPTSDTPQRKTLQKVATLLEADGHQVTTVPVEQFI